MALQWQQWDLPSPIRKLFSEADEIKYGKATWGTSSSPDVCSLPSPSTRCILWTFPGPHLSYKAHLRLPRTVGSRELGIWTVCKALFALLGRVLEARESLQTQLPVTFLQGFEGFIWEPCSDMPGSRRGLSHGGR